MAKKTPPTITHIAILHLAIRQPESEIESQTAYMETYLADYTKERITKIEVLKTMYQIKTGTNYDLRGNTQ